MNDDSNFSGPVNLSVTAGSGIVVFEPTAVLVETASIIWSGNAFTLGSGQVLSFIFSGYAAGAASSFTAIKLGIYFNRRWAQIHADERGMKLKPWEP